MPFKWFRIVHAAPNTMSNKYKKNWYHVNAKIKFNHSNNITTNSIISQHLRKTYNTSRLKQPTIFPEATSIALQLRALWAHAVFSGFSCNARFDWHAYHAITRRNLAGRTWLVSEKFFKMRFFLFIWLTVPQLLVHQKLVSVLVHKSVIATGMQRPFKITRLWTKETVYFSNKFR